MENRDPLSDLLQRWQPQPASRPDFANEVEERIAAAESTEPGGMLRFPALLPWAAAIAILIGSVSGIGLSRLEHKSTMADAYARSIDPVMMTHSPDLH